MTQVTIHDQLYQMYTWEEFGEDVFTLAAKISEQHLKIDRVIALAKGGVTISRPVLDLLGLAEMSSIQIEFYNGIASTEQMPVITQSLPVRIKGESILILDDLSDSGESFIAAVHYLSQHGTTKIQTASLLIKPWSKFKPDFFVRETKAWIIFPWEIRETILLLSDMWKKKGDSKDKIKKQLRQVGFTTQQISTFAFRKEE